MIHVLKKEECCGCGACAQRCPLQCITMQQDNQGFLYPLVNLSLCINCHQCERVCPVINQNPTKIPIAVYAGINQNEEIRYVSSSGGVFTLLAEEVINRRGVVFGARFDDSWSVFHDFVQTVDDISLLRGSKYMQSDVRDRYKVVEQFLKCGRYVLFSGTPCQIAGLRCFLTKDYDNLLLVDIACHGVPSSIIWSSYLKHHVLGRGPISDLSFRDKSSGWKNYSILFKQNGETFLDSHIENLFMRGYLNDYYLRPSCYSCFAKKGKANSDIMIADFWGVDKVVSGLDDDKGINLVLVYTEKGKEIVTKVCDNLQKTEYNQAVANNRSIEKSARKPFYYNWYWKQFKKVGFPAFSMKPTVFYRFYSKLLHIFG